MAIWLISKTEIAKPLLIHLVYLRIGMDERIPFFPDGELVRWRRGGEGRGKGAAPWPGSMEGRAVGHAVVAGRAAVAREGRERSDKGEGLA